MNRLLGAAIISSLALPALAQSIALTSKYPGKVHLLPATLETTQWGSFDNAQPPVLTGMSAAVSYKSGSTAILLTSSADVTDADTTTFGGAKLTVSLSHQVAREWREY